MPKTNSRDTYKLQVLSRAFCLLDLLAASPRPIGLNEIADGLKLHKSTAHRFLMVLEQQRMIVRTSAGKFRLGLRLFDYGSRALEQYDLRDCSQQPLQILVGQVQETAHLCVLENLHMVYIEKMEPERSVRMISRVGATSPVHCTAVGKAILAAMTPEAMRQITSRLSFRRITPKTLTDMEGLLQNIARVQRRGYAVDDEECEEGVRCVAMAIQDAIGTPVAAVSISGPTFRVTSRQIPSIVANLAECVKQIRREMGYCGRQAIASAQAARRRNRSASLSVS